MKFPVTVKHRRAEAVIYAKSEGYPYYRLAYRAAGKRIVRSFSTYAEARKEARAKVRELSKGKQSIALSAKEAADALAIRDALEAFRQTTGRTVTAIQAVTGFLDASKLLPADQSLSGAVRSHLRTEAVVQRKLVEEAVTEFCRARQAKTIAQPGKRPALNPIYVADTSRQLDDFSKSFPATAVSDLSKSHLEVYLGARGELSPKSRNHIRSTVSMFLTWCVRRDYLSANHRLLEADALRKEPMDATPIDFYRPKELDTLLKKSSGSIRAVIALQALGGLRLQEALRLDWSEIFKIPGHIEVSSSKSKTRQRRLVEVCPALELWLKPYQGHKGRVCDLTLNVYTHTFVALRKKLKIPPRRNGLRHGFVTYHFASHANENHTAAQAGNSPAMIHAHYKGLATKAEAEKWFDVRPT
jgi:integrase